MIKKRQLLTIISVAVMSFIVGTTLNANFTAVGSGEEGIPFAKIWEAIFDLRGRVESIEESINGADFEEFINETSRVEFLRMIPTGDEIYHYEYGVSGHWNISMIQTEPIIEKLLSTLSGVTSISVGGFTCSPFANQGYEHGIVVSVDRELSEAEVEAVRSVIEEYLAKP